MSSAVVVLVAAPLAACGGDGEVSLPTPTRSLTVSPTRTPSLPTPTRTPSETPAPTEEPSEPPSESPTEEPSEPSETPTEEPTPTPTPTKTPKPTETVTVTESPTPTETPSESATPTETPSESATPTESPTESPSPTETAEPDETEAAEEDEENWAPAWVYWLLGLVLLAAAIGIPLYLWARRRNGWRSEVAAAEADMVWLARTHLPELRLKADSPERVAGGWEVAGEGRASAAEDHLTALEASAPDETEAARVRALRDGVRAARLRLSGLQGLTSAEAVAGTLDAAIADLETPLGPPPQA